MVTEITTALVQAINAHPTTAIAAMGSIGGTLAGAAGNFAFDRWRNGGKVQITLVEMMAGLRGKDASGAVTSVTDPSKGMYVDFLFYLRILNTYPIPKTLEVLRVDFFANKAGRWTKAEPLLTQQFIRLQDRAVDQGTLTQIEPHSFVRRSLAGQASAPKPVLAERLEGCRTVRIQVLVSPRKILTIWHTFPEGSLGWVKKAPKAAEEKPAA